MVSQQCSHSFIGDLREAAGIFNSMVPYVRKPSFVVSLHGEQKSVENVN